MMHVGVISLLPAMFDALSYGVTGRAIEQGLVKIDHWNPRDWAQNTHRQVDDRPYGGGPGMVMMYEPLHGAIVHARQQMPSNAKVVYLSPQGQSMTQDDLNQIVFHQTPLIFVAGRYEGIDERLLMHDIDEEWSLGDFVLSGGELAAMVFLDAMIRLVPGSLGHCESAQQDSFMQGILDHPHYTRPREVGDLVVPEVLLQGNHRDIERWRRQQALGKTWLKRKDLIEKLTLTPVDEKLLAEFKQKL